MGKPFKVDYSASDFLGGTILLDAWEELAFRRICDLIYVTHDDLPDNNKLAQLTKVGRRWTKIRARLIELGKIEEINGRISQPRCRRELADAEARIIQAKRAGMASAEKRKALKELQGESTGVTSGVGTQDPTADPTTYQLPATIKKEPPVSPKGDTPACQETSKDPGGERPAFLDRGEESQDAPAEMVRIWNEVCGAKVVKAQKLHDSRRRTLTKRLKEDFGGSLSEWRAYCERIVAAPHLIGTNDRGWRASLDWVLRPANMTKVLEGNYDPPKPNGGNGLDADLDRWRARVKVFEDSGSWVEDDWGPPPGSQGCRAPAEAMV